MTHLPKSEKHPEIPYVLFGCTCSLCQRFGGPDNQPKKQEPDNRPAEVIIREDRDSWPH